MTMLKLFLTSYICINKLDVAYFCLQFTLMLLNSSNSPNKKLGSELGQAYLFKMLLQSKFKYQCMTLIQCMW